MQKIKSNENVIKRIFVDEKSPKTIKFQKYVIEKVLESQPLQIGDLIRIRIKEGETPFPKFQENVFYKNTNQWPPDVIAEFDSYSFEKSLALMSYLSDKFDRAIIADEPKIEQDVPLTLYIPLVAGEPSKIYNIANQLGLNKELFNNYVSKNKKSVSKFSENSSEIAWNGIKISIPKDTDEFDFCKIMFELKPFQKISWDLVFEKIEESEPEGDKKEWHKIYNTMRRVNFKIHKETGKNLFIINNKNICRID